MQGAQGGLVHGQSRYQARPRPPGLHRLIEHGVEFNNVWGSILHMGQELKVTVSTRSSGADHRATATVVTEESGPAGSALDGHFRLPKEFAPALMNNEIRHQDELCSARPSRAASTPLHCGHHGWGPISPDLPHALWATARLRSLLHRCRSEQCRGARGPKGEA